MQSTFASYDKIDVITYKYVINVAMRMTYCIICPLSIYASAYGFGMIKLL
jgi:hypothetical protein